MVNCVSNPCSDRVKTKARVDRKRLVLPVRQSKRKIMSYAIIEASGTQLRVEAGRFYDLNRLHAEPDATYTIDKVLLINHDGEITVGQPYIEGATVEGTVISHLRGRKVLVYKMKPKKKTRKKRGHRQELTRLMVDAISFNGTRIALEATESESSSEMASEAAPAEPTTPEAVETQETVTTESVQE